MKKIVIRIENVKISASLNDTKAAEDLAARFPLKVKCTDIGGFYQGILARGLFDPLEYKKDAEVGDIAFQKGELLIRTGKEGNHDYKHFMVVGHIDKPEKINKLPEAVLMQME